ncbi:MAG TPA: class I SAM-dependent methyltransferase [Gammaproteobacteria bacterium]
MKPLKALVSLIPGGKRWAARRSERRRRLKLAAIGSAEQIFTHYYEVNQWKNPESVSGIGSTLANTHNIRRELPALMERFGFETLLDAPCGDFNWFRAIPRSGGFSYIGGDIVQPLVASNAAAYGDDRTRFIALDIVNDPLPSADLWMCRDCLIHLSYDDICSAIERFLESDIEYLLTTVHTGCELNRDIPTGDFRLLNLELEPFRFPAPILYVDDSADGLPARAMGLWRRGELLEALADNPWFSRGDS